MSTQPKGGFSPKTHFPIVERQGNWDLLDSKRLCLGREGSSEVGPRACKCEWHFQTGNPFNHTPNLSNPVPSNPQPSWLKINWSSILSFFPFFLFFISLYIYAVESKPGPRFGVFWVKTWSKVASKRGPRFFFCLFFPQFYSVFWVS